MFCTTVRLGGNGAICCPVNLDRTTTLLPDDDHSVSAGDAGYQHTDMGVIEVEELLVAFTQRS